jgi:hypothetical protein
MNAYSLIFNRKQCFGLASPSMSEVITVLPGYKKWTPDSAHSQTMGILSCSWAQITRSKNAGIWLSVILDLLLVPNYNSWFIF